MENEPEVYLSDGDDHNNLLELIRNFLPQDDSKI